jgi:hypothetical protein
MMETMAQASTNMASTGDVVIDIVKSLRRDGPSVFWKGQSVLFEDAASRFARRFGSKSSLNGLFKRSDDRFFGDFGKAAHQTISVSISDAQCHCRSPLQQFV